MPEEPHRLWEAWRSRGDARAFEDLVRPELGRAVALAKSEGCPPGEAEDAVQESLIRLAQERSEVPARVGVRGWFFGIVRDRARARRRSDHRRRLREHAAAVPEVVPGEEARYALRDEVERALAGLPEEEREAIRLRYLLDLEYREVAYVLGTSEGASRMRVSRALKRLRSVLGAGAGAALATVVFPEPARASVLVSTALSVAPTSAVTLAGGTILMTIGQKLLISAVVAGVLGAVLGASTVHHLGATDAAMDRERVEVDLAATRKALAEAVAESRGLKERLHALQADRDSLAKEVEESRASAKLATKTDSKNGSAASSSTAPVQPTLSAIEQKARELSAAWISDALQIQDPAKRASALASIQEALGSGDPARVLAGLWAVGGIGHLKYDKATMRAPVLSQLDAEDPMLRKGALWALLNLDRQPGDLDLVLRLKDDPSPEVRKEVPRFASLIGGGDLTGEVGDVVLKALQAAVTRDRSGESGWKGTGTSPEFRMFLTSIRWGNLSPELEQALMGLAKDPRYRTDVVHFVCMNAEKTPAVVDLLIEVVGSPGAMDNEAVLALTRGIPASLQARVAATLLKVMETRRPDSGAWDYCLYGLQQYGSEDNIPTLQELGANELVSQQVREKVNKAIEAIQKRVHR